MRNQLNSNKMKKIFSISVFLTMCMFANAVTYSISNDGKEFIKSVEKCKLTAYPDAGGYSIGWGHHGSDVTAGMTINQKRADKYFNEDIKAAEGMVNWLLKQLPYEYKFSQGFIDGMVSLVYNAGAGNVQKSAFYQRLKRCRVKGGKMNESDFVYTLAAVKTSCVTCKGHKPRRVQEYNMMIN